MKSNVSSGDSIAPDSVGSGYGARPDITGAPQHGVDEISAQRETNNYFIDESACDDKRPATEKMPDQTFPGPGSAAQKTNAKIDKDNKRGNDWEKERERSSSSAARDQTQDVEEEYEATAVPGDSRERRPAGDEPSSCVTTRPRRWVWTTAGKSKNRPNVPQEPAIANKEIKNRRHWWQSLISRRQEKTGVDSGATVGDQSHDGGERVAEAHFVNTTPPSTLGGETVEVSEERGDRASEVVPGRAPRPSTPSPEPVEGAGPGEDAGAISPKTGESQLITIRPTRVFPNRSLFTSSRWLELTFPSNSSRLADEYCTELNRRFRKYARNYALLCPAPHRPDSHPGSAPAAIKVMVPVYGHAELVSDEGRTTVLRFQNKDRAANFQRFAILFTPLDAKTLVIPSLAGNEYREMLACIGSRMEYHFQIRPADLLADVPTFIPRALVFKTPGTIKTKEI